MNERRCKMVQATPELLAHMFIPTDRDVRVVADGTIPQTAKFVGGGYDHRTDLMYFTFEDASFDPVPPGEMIPLACPMFSERVPQVKSPVSFVGFDAPAPAAGPTFVGKPTAIVADPGLLEPKPVYIDGVHIGYAGVSKTSCDAITKACQPAVGGTGTPSHEPKPFCLNDHFSANFSEKWIAALDAIVYGDAPQPVVIDTAVGGQS